MGLDSLDCLIAFGSGTTTRLCLDAFSNIQVDGLLASPAAFSHSSYLTAHTQWYSARPVGEKGRGGR